MPMVAGGLEPLKSLRLVILESIGTTVACSRLGLMMATALTGIFLSSNDVNGKLPPLATCALADTITSLIAGPDGKACHFASMPRLPIRPWRSITMLTVFWPDQGGWNATVIGHQPFSLSQATDLSDTLS